MSTKMERCAIIHLEKGAIFLLIMYSIFTLGYAMRRNMWTKLLRTDEIYSFQILMKDLYA